MPSGTRPSAAALATAPNVPLPPRARASSYGSPIHTPIVNGMLTTPSATTAGDSTQFPD